VAVVHDNLPEIQGGRAPVGIVYQKGGWVLHMLRSVVGTEKFWEGMRLYYRHFRDSNASTADLRHTIEEVWGDDLGWFFQQWLYRAGSPVIEASWRYDAAAKKVELDLTQTQSGDAYRLPVEVAIAGKVSRVEMTAREQKFALDCDSEPAAVDLDPNVWLLMRAKVVKR
jgi:aminopeptidase N